MNRICQSCGLSLEQEELFGTNADGSKNDTYCKFCFQNGKFGKNETLEFFLIHGTTDIVLLLKESSNNYLALLLQTYLVGFKTDFHQCLPQGKFAFRSRQCVLLILRL